jgi:hypothetical protein
MAEFIPVPVEVVGGGEACHHVVAPVDAENYPEDQWWFTCIVQAGDDEFERWIAERIAAAWNTRAPESGIVAEMRRQAEADAALIAALRADLLKFVGPEFQSCEGCDAPLDYDEDTSTVADVRGCWGYVADVKDAPCFRYRTVAGAERSWPPCSLLSKSEQER